jgi:predicted O-methyltransferase YrrM
MNCIFICIFNNEDYIKLFYLLLESIYIYGNLTDETDILVYTSSNFMNIIKQSHLYSKKIKFELNDNYNDIDKACKARLDLFKLDSIVNYNKILYLDTDIIVKNDINKVFDVCQKDILYTLEEGTIDGEFDYWGKTLFEDETIIYDDKSAFTTAVLLFNNCEKIKFLFDKINKDIINRADKSSFHDQPYIVYNAFRYNLYDNKILKTYVVNYNYDIHSPYVIHHFPGGPGIYSNKVSYMIFLLDEIKDYKILTLINKAKEYINQNLLPIIQDSGEQLEGNIFMKHQTSEYTDVFLNKTKNIVSLVLNTNIRNVMEIGFNSGFSTLLMLLSNPNIKMTCFDLGDHKYTLPCYKKLKETFGDRINLILGDSTVTLPEINDKYDLIHIDGGHTTKVAESDISNSTKLSKQGTILIMDDYDLPNLHDLWDYYVRNVPLNKLDIKLYPTKHHDIKYIKK